MGITEKIKEIEYEYSRTQKNKATEGHLGLLKAKLAMLRRELIKEENTVSAGPGGPGTGFEVQKHGHSRIAMIGFPSVGKSSFLNLVTDQESEAANYEFTTLTCIPGKLWINDAELQLLDLPGIIDGAAQGRGRGKQVIAVGRSSDLILMMLDAQKGEDQKQKLTYELESCGIRLNKTKPKITIKVQKTGGIFFHSAQPLTKIDEKMVKAIFHQYRIHNAHIKFNGDYDVDDLIDAIEGNRKYLKCIFCYNKIDIVSIEEITELVKDEQNAAISVQMNLGIDILLEKIWDQLGLVRVYTKRHALAPDFSDPLVLTNSREGLTIKGALLQIHKDFMLEFSHAMVWGRSVKFSPQRVGMMHTLCDEDVMQLFKNKAGL